MKRIFFLSPAHAGGKRAALLINPKGTFELARQILPILGERLLFPADFAGRGDMSRGALLLHSVATNEELPYLPVSRARRSSARSEHVSSEAIETREAIPRTACSMLV